MAHLKHRKSLRQSKNIPEILVEPREQILRQSTLFPLNNKYQAAHCSWRSQKVKVFLLIHFCKNEHYKG